MDDRGGFVEMWQRRWDPSHLPIDFFPQYVLPKKVHYTLEESASASDPRLAGKAIMKQGLYHCNPQDSRCVSTPMQVIYHDGMEYVKCSDIINPPIKRLICS
jgi:hypothetical protein